MIEVNWTYRARILRAVDGDTLDAEIDNGFHNTERHHLRLTDVDTPELYRGDADQRYAGRKAREDTEGWLAAHDNGSGWPFLVVTEKDRRSFNRYLATVYDRDGNCLNDYLRERYG